MLARLLLALALAFAPFRADAFYRGPRSALASARRLDPLALRPFVYWSGSIGRLFTDTGGTTSVSADNQAVALLRDESPNARDFSQATVGSRPLVGGLATGKPFIVGDAIDDRLIGPAISGWGDVTIIAAIEFSSAGTGYNRVFESNNAAGFWIGSDLGRTGIGGGCIETVSPFGTFSPISNGQRAVITLRRIGAVTTLRRDGAVVSSRTTTNAGLAGTLSLLGGATAFSSHKLFWFIVIPAPSDASVSALEAIAARKL